MAICFTQDIQYTHRKCRRYIYIDTDIDIDMMGYHGIYMVNLSWPLASPGESLRRGPGRRFRRSRPGRGRPGGRHGGCERPAAVAEAERDGKSLEGWEMRDLLLHGF